MKPNESQYNKFRYQTPQTRMHFRSKKKQKTKNKSIQQYRQQIALLFLPLQFIEQFKSSQSDTGS
jgi:hypothetical protein